MCIFSCVRAWRQDRRSSSQVGLRINDYIVYTEDNQSHESVTETTNGELSSNESGTSTSIPQSCENRQQTSEKRIENKQKSDRILKDKATKCCGSKTEKMICIGLFTIGAALFSSIFILPNIGLFSLDNALERLKDDSIKLAVSTKFLMCPPEGKIMASKKSILNSD